MKTKSVASQKALRKRLIAHAMAKPGAWVDHPWGEDVAKVGEKVSVFFGTGQGDFGMGVKLPESGPLALAQAGVKPSAYGLGKFGWVSIQFGEATLPYEMLCDWITESYRSVALEKLVKALV